MFAHALLHVKFSSLQTRHMTIIALFPSLTLWHPCLPLPLFPPFAHVSLVCTKGRKCLYDQDNPGTNKPRMFSQCNAHTHIHARAHETSHRFITATQADRYNGRNLIDQAMRKQDPAVSKASRGHDKSPKRLSGVSPTRRRSRPFSAQIRKAPHKTTQSDISYRLSAYCHLKVRTKTLYRFNG